MVKDRYLSEVHKKKKLSPNFLAHSYKPAGEEAITEKVSFRMTKSMKERLEKYKEQEGHLPWDRVREDLDEILSPLEETS